MTFRALRVFEQDGAPVARLVEMHQDELSPGEVVIQVSHSSLNYKDALALIGRGRILKLFPLNAGIDAAGVVLSSQDPSLRPGDPVLVHGMGLGESVDGGLAQRIRVPAEWIVPLPPGLTAWEAMALGTAGFTAALCLHRMEQNGQLPEMGPILVTGASGGVGQIAVALFSRRGYEVVAVSGRPEHADALRALGASEVKTPEALGLGPRPLESGRFGGAVDNLGGELLSGLLRHVRPWGNVAVVGNTSGAGFEATVFPLILRGVSLLGISSTNCSMTLRRELWSRLGSDWKPEALERIASRTLPLSKVPRAGQDLVDRKSHGRTVVDCSLA